MQNFSVLPAESGERENEQKLEECLYRNMERERERWKEKYSSINDFFFFLFSILFVESFYKCDSLYILLYFKVDIMQG